MEEKYSRIRSSVEEKLSAGKTPTTRCARRFPRALLAQGHRSDAPKIRAMLIIGEFEPRARGACTGCHGDPGFNRESQLSISIRTAIHNADTAYFHAGAGIVGDSIPEAEYDETMAKARGFLAALELGGRRV